MVLYGFAFVKSYSSVRAHLVVKVENDKCSSQCYSTRGIAVSFVLFFFYLSDLSLPHFKQFNSVQIPMLDSCMNWDKKKNPTDLQIQAEKKVHYASDPVREITAPLSNRRSNFSSNPTRGSEIKQRK